MAAALVALLGCELVLAGLAHDHADHQAEHDAHACVMCTFSQAQEVGSPVLGEILSPLAARLEAPDEVRTAYLATTRCPHPARGPPALRV